MRAECGDGPEHFCLPIKNRSFFYLKDCGLDGAPDYSWGLNLDPLGRKNIAVEMARDDHNVRLDLAGDIGFIPHNEDVRSKNLPFEVAVDARRAFKLEPPL